MIKITEKEYKKIQRLREEFYEGVEEYCENLDDTSHFRNPFEMIMDIIDEAKKGE